MSNDCEFAEIHVKNANSHCLSGDIPGVGATITQHPEETLVLKIPGLLPTEDDVLYGGPNSFDVDKYITRRNKGITSARGVFHDFFYDMYGQSSTYGERPPQSKLMTIDPRTVVVANDDQLGAYASYEDTAQITTSAQWSKSFSATNFLYVQAPLSWRERVQLNDPNVTKDQVKITSLVRNAVETTLSEISKAQILMIDSHYSIMHLGNNSKQPQAENRFTPGSLVTTQKIPDHKIKYVEMVFRIPFTAKFDGTFSWTTVKEGDETTHSVAKKETEPSLVGYIERTMLVPCVHLDPVAGDPIDYYTKRTPKPDPDKEDKDPFTYDLLLIPAFFHHYRTDTDLAEVDMTAAQKRSHFIKSITDRKGWFWGRDVIPADKAVTIEGVRGGYIGDLTLRQLWEQSPRGLYMKPAEKKYGRSDTYPDIGFFKYNGQKNEWKINTDLLLKLKHSLRDCNCVKDFELVGGWKIQYHYGSGEDRSLLHGTNQTEYAQITKEFHKLIPPEPPTTYEASTSTLVLQTPADMVPRPGLDGQPRSRFVTPPRYLDKDNVMKFNK